jgi:NAD-dependent dihydropyrimidine dehydrogenase PreA subunit
VNVFEMIDSPEHPTSAKKSDPVRENDCIDCMACEVQCPVQAIKISTST